MIINLPRDVKELLFSFCSADDVKNLSCISRHYNEALREILFSSTRINVSSLNAYYSAEEKKLAPRLEVLKYAEHLRLDGVLDKGVCVMLNRSILGLEELSIFSNGITDDHIKILCMGLRDLKKLYLRNCPLVTNIATLSTKLLVSLEELTLTSSQITYGVQNISQLPLLRKLDLSNSKYLNDDSLQYIFKLKCLQSLSLCYNYRITFNVASNPKELKPCLADLQELFLDWCSIDVPEGLKKIAGFKKLKRLSLGTCRDMSDKGVACLVGLTQLTDLGLSYCRNLTKDCFPYLRELKYLQKLTIDDHLVCDAIKELSIPSLLCASIYGRVPVHHPDAFKQTDH